MYNQSVLTVSYCNTVSQSLRLELHVKQLPQCMQLAELTMADYSCDFPRFSYFSNFKQNFQIKSNCSVSVKSLHVRSNHQNCSKHDL